MARFIHDRRPKDVAAQWDKVRNAEGLAFIAPVARGGRRSLIDLELGFPGGNILKLVGGALRPLLAPLATRDTQVTRS